MGDLKYVKDFEFPSDRGFSGSAGVQQVRAYQRGGRVKATAEKASAKRSAKKPTIKASTGGTVGVKTERGPKSRRPKDTMTAAAQGGSVHDKLYAAGGKMGYARGGQVKDTSGEFDMKSKPMASMDHGVYPAQSTTQQEKEAGGRKKVRPRFKSGGKVQVARTKMITKRQREELNKDHTKGKGKSKRGMPKKVKARGGLAKYAEGGSVSPGLLGTGGARNAARALKEREDRVKSTVNEALADQRRGPASPKPRAQKKDKPPRQRHIHKTVEEGVTTFSDRGPAGTEYRKRAGGGRVGKRGAAR